MTGGDGSTTGADGSMTGGDGSMTGGDGSMTRTDGSAGDIGDAGPLMQPLPDFCTGHGTVVTVGGNGQCAGTIAQNTFRYGVCACDTVSVQSNMSIDSFNSTSGPDGASLPDGGVNVGNDGDLGINTGLMMSGMLTVQGAAFIGAGNFSVGQQSFVYSTIYINGAAMQANSFTTSAGASSGRRSAPRSPVPAIPRRALRAPRRVLGIRQHPLRQQHPLRVGPTPARDRATARRRTPACLRTQACPPTPGRPAPMVASVQQDLGRAV